MPVPGSGLGSQIGFAEESVWGTGVTPTRFYPFDSETIAWKPKAVQGMGLQAGAYTNQGSLRANTSYAVAGDVQMDFTSKQMGLLLKHALGAVATVQNGATLAYTHTFTLGSSLNGKGMTCQVGRPQTNGTVVPFTYTGGKVNSWDISCAAEDIVKFKTTWQFQNRTTTTALATPSYPTGSNVFYFKEGTVNVNGTPYLAVRDFTLTGTNNLDVAEYYIGNAGLIAEPVRNGFTTIKVSGSADFVDTTISGAYSGDTENTMVLSFVGNQIVTGTPNYYETLTITLGGLRFNGAEPLVAGPAVLNVAFDADALVPIGGGSPISIAYTTLDALP